MKNKIIPTFIIEEHHEAFIIWNYAIQQGLIHPSNNILFHVDEHSDMGSPRFNKSILSLNGGISEVKDFTYNELGIAGFIVPAVYKNIINKVYWIRQKHAKRRTVKMFVRSYNRAGKKLIMGKEKVIDQKKKVTTNIDKKNFTYFHRTIEQIPHCKNVILDVDIDYFSSVTNPNELEELYIEITKNEYNSFISNKYHRLHYVGIQNIQAIIRNNKYYYVFNNYEEVYPDKLTVDENTIEERINKFINILIGKKIEPAIINICRSRFSGYTPKEQLNFIESNLLEQLNNIYSIDINHVEDI